MEPHSPKGSVSTAIEMARSGDKPSQDFLFVRYFQKLVGAAVPYLSAIRPGARDEEIPASSAMREVIQRLEHGLLPSLTNRKELLGYLMVTVRSKALQQVRGINGPTRGGRITGELQELMPGVEATPEAEAFVVDGEPQADEILAFKELFELAKESLSYPLLEMEGTTQEQEQLQKRVQAQIRVLEMTIQGYTNEEIAESVRYSKSWVKDTKARIQEDLLFARYWQKLVSAALPYLWPVRTGGDELETPASKDLRQVVQRFELGFRPDKEFLAFLMVAMRSKARQQVREINSPTRDGLVTGELQEVMPSVEGAPNMELFVLEGEPRMDEILALWDLFEVAKRLLSPPLDRVFEMTIQGYTNKQIAESLGFSQTSVKDEKLRIQEILKSAFQLS